MPWQKGQSGNPNGRKPNERCLTVRLRKGLEEKDADGKTNLEVIVWRVLTLARMGEKWAVEFIADRVEGKVPTPLEHTGEEGSPIVIKFLKGPDDS